MPDNKNLLPCKPCFSENKQDLVKKQKLTIGLAPVTLKHFHSHTAPSCRSSQIPSFLSTSFCLSPPKNPLLHVEKEPIHCTLVYFPAGLQGLLPFQDMTINKKFNNLIQLPESAVILTGRGLQQSGATNLMF